MYKHFHPLMQDIQNNKFEWMDDVELIFSNTALFVVNNVPKSVLKDLSQSSKEYESCYFYYTVLYSNYYDSIMALGKRLPSYNKISMDLSQQYTDKKLTWDEYQQKLDELGPDPRNKWKFNQETMSWEKKQAE